jgi:hypothetical protein
MQAQPAQPSSPRARRGAAARWLAASPRRAELAWADLAAWPGWADLPPDRLQQLAFAAGAWAHADTVRRCIDGRVLKHLRSRLGESALRSLMQPPEEPQAAMPLLLGDLDAALLDTLLPAIGRDWLLASVASPLLREALREQLWPAAGPALRAINGAAAASVVALALRCIEERWQSAAPVSPNTMEPLT